MTGQDAQVKPIYDVGRSDCGMYAFLSRKAAKGFIKRHSLNGMNVFEACNGLFHTGYLPPTVKQGVQSRQDIAFDPERRRRLVDERRRSR